MVTLEYSAKEKREEAVAPLQEQDLGKIAYPHFLSHQAALLAKKERGEKKDYLLFAEHEPLYTAGIREKSPPATIAGLPVYSVPRGGKMTYHGPGMLMSYFVVDLRERHWTIKELLRRVFSAAEEAFAAFSLSCTGSFDPPGLWVTQRKIASVGLCVSRGKTTHGLAFHLNCDLAPFFFIEPCGLSPDRITSYVQETGHPIAIASFQKTFAGSLNLAFRKPLAS